jgi:DNA polymerase (family 10)
MIDRAKELNYEYIGFSEHNPKQSGHTKQEIIDIMKRRHEYIKEHAHGLPYFIGLEVDILPSGELALPEKAFDYVDYLVVSVHSSFNQPKEEMTRRVKTALLHPKVKIFGHPTARLLMKRDSIDLKWDEIFDVAKKKNIALEINSSPERLDLPDALVREGVKYGLKFSVDTDAHAVMGMDGMKHGVLVARRGWAEKKDIVNALPYREFSEWVKNP